MTQTSSAKTYFLFLMVILIWGLNWPMNKIGMDYMPAIWHAVFRLGIGSLSMFGLVLVLGKFKVPTKQDFPIVFILGLLQLGLFTLFINLGLMTVDAGRSSILVYTVPLWATPIAMIFFKERMNWLKALGLGLGIFGIVILFSPFSIDWSNPQTLYGNGVLLGAALCMAISICLARNMTWHSTPLELLPWQLLVGTLPALLIAFIMDPNPIIEWNMVSIPAMAYTAVLATAIGNGGIAMVSRKIPSINVSLGLLGVPLTGVISAALILGEDITITMKLAMIFIFLGLICVALSGKLSSSTCRGLSTASKEIS